MSSSSDRTPPPSSTNWAPLVDEIRWVIQIRHTLDEEHDDSEADGVPVSIFTVPKLLLQTKPEAYLPQMIALGPYHRWRPELYEMERYKLSAAKRVQRCLSTNKFQDLVNCLGKHERLVRAHYHRYLDFNGDTLAWMMAVDACFLLEFLQIYMVDDDGRVLSSRRIPTRMSHLVDLAGRKSAHNTILRDIMMLENQIPLFLLRKILDLRRGEAVTAEETMKTMLTAFMKELSPFKMWEDFPPVDNVKRHSHLLEILYYILVPKQEKQEDESDVEEEGPGGGGDGRWLSQGEEGDGSSSVKRLLTASWQMMSNLSNSVLVRHMKKAITSKPMVFVAKAPWKMLATIPGFAFIKKPVESLLPSGEDKDSPEKKGDPSLMKKPPLVEEIMIPSVTELVSAGVQFRPTYGDLTTVSFDPKSASFSLPVVSLDSNTEAVLRNLVAYEAAAASGPLVLARYTELMNGIIDTENDVRLLRERGVVINRMKSDAKAADLWNGMNRSVRLTKVEHLDRAIEGVNRYHSGRCRVRAGRFMRKYVFGSWPLLTFIAAVLMLLLTALQAFCSVYSCSRWFHDVPIVTQQQP